jgi:hypothetical protein
MCSGHRGCGDGHTLALQCCRTGYLGGTGVAHSHRPTYRYSAKVAEPRTAWLTRRERRFLSLPACHAARPTCSIGFGSQSLNIRFCEQPPPSPVPAFGFSHNPFLQPSEERVTAHADHATHFGRSIVRLVSYRYRHTNVAPTIAKQTIGCDPVPSQSTFVQVSGVLSSRLAYPACHRLRRTAGAPPLWLSQHAPSTLYGSHRPCTAWPQALRYTRTLSASEPPDYLPIARTRERDSPGGIDNQLVHRYSRR